MNPTRTESIQRFLAAKTHSDLAALYNHDMEVQVNVVRADGKPIKQGDFKGHEWNAFSNGSMTWKPIRIPLNAKSDPTYTDSMMTFPLDLYAEGIGMTGWDWKNRLSRWVAFDFDAIVGHSDKHGKRLDDKQLLEVQDVVTTIPFVTLRRSTSGKGLHLYVFLQPVPTANHTEHAALARAILSMLSGLTGFDFGSKVDVCGGNMWVWHRKMYADFENGIKNDGLKVIKVGQQLNTIPANWRDHIGVMNRKARRATPSFVGDVGSDAEFEELTGQRTRVSLDPVHRRLIEWLANNGCVWWWDSDSHMLVTHTYHLKEAHVQLGYRGNFETISQGKDIGHDHNCFCFPLRNGAWVVRRHSQQTKEHDSWEQGSGWTRCFYNRDPDVYTLARINEGVELERGGYEFRHAGQALKVLTAMGVAIELPGYLHNRKTVVKPLPKEGKIVVHVEHNSMDTGGVEMRLWRVDKGWWKRIYQAKFPVTGEAESNENYDDIVRHVTSSGMDAGWLMKRDGAWVEEPLVHVRAALGALGNDSKESATIVGASVMKAWNLVNKPFQPEYPGNREWNRNAAQLAVTPNPDLDNLSYPHWTRVLEHCGSGLNEAIEANEWCQRAGITKGSEFLMLWIASVFKRPDQPTTYLAFWGPQDSGKSIFHEMISEILITTGAVRADNALQSTSNFNGELANAIFCIVEETDLSANKVAYNRIKDWVTSPEIMIRPLFIQGYMMKNCTHWIQCSNPQEACPIFEGDTRVTLIHVPALSPSEMIPKLHLKALLRKEAPDFLAAILAMDLPESDSRLAVPTIETEGKRQAAERNMSILELFIKEEINEVNGQCVSADAFYDRMQLWLESSSRDKSYWSKQRIGRELPSRFPRGRLTTNQLVHYGNMSLEKNALPDGKYVQKPSNGPVKFMVKEH